MGGGDRGWQLHEQEVLSVPLNLESGLGEQTEGERLHSAPPAQLIQVLESN